jgi:hypothetical protein
VSGLRLRRIAHPALLLFIVAVLAYGLLLPQLGFYWDELPMSWIRYELGPAAMTRYFSTNRPVWGLLYQLTTRLLPQIPIYWEAFALFWRWLGALLVWAIARAIWPERRGPAVTAALLFLVYPGFNQQWTSYLYSHFFIVLDLLLLSLLCTIWASRSPRWAPIYTAAGLVLAALNLWMMEYFFVLELWRGALIAHLARDHSASRSSRQRMRWIMGAWAPYLLVFAANIAWRLLVFNNQIYQPTLLSALRQHPIQALAGVFRTVAAQLYTVTIVAWSQIFQFSMPGGAGPATMAYYLGVVLATVAVILLYRLVSTKEAGSPPVGSGWWPLALGGTATVLAGGPFLLTGLEVTTAYPANRFTLPFMLGVSILLAALLQLIPRKVGLLVAVALVALAAGRQAVWADAFRREWATQKSMFWQMLWRAPGIKPHTMVLMNEGALPYYADNSLSGPLNWIYDPGNRSSAMDYVLFYPTSRTGGTLPTLEANRPVTYDFIAETFTGNTSQSLAFYFSPPGCLRLLDPSIDPQNHFVSDDSLMRAAARLSSAAWITKQATARMPAIYQPEPPHGWCYYFERAELAAQFGDWASVSTLADAGLALEDHPNDPVERFVTIRGYAHTGQWEKALEQTAAAYRVSKVYVGPLLCRLWGQIGAEPDVPVPPTVSAEVQSMLACPRE